MERKRALYKYLNHENNKFVVLTKRANPSQYFDILCDDLTQWDRISEDNFDTYQIV